MKNDAPSIDRFDLLLKVDIIVSEPIGFLLVHERMLESFIAARDLYLRPGGLMMPTTSDIVVAPFTDAALWTEQTGMFRTLCPVIIFLFTA